MQNYISVLSTKTYTEPPLTGGLNFTPSQ